MTTPSLGKTLSSQRVESALQLVASLLDTEWAYSDASEALRLIHDGLDEIRVDLADLDEDADADVVRHYGLQALRTVAELTGFVGFILRSSDTRNSFEIYSPIKEIGSALLGEKIKLIVGSEWNYTPFVYPLPTSVLADFILVGLPASEAQNSLLIPVAGHELGHAVWRRIDVNKRMTPLISAKVLEEFRSRWGDVKTLFPSDMAPEKLATDLIALEIIGHSSQFALRQCEEVFCDLFGFWLFGDAFLSAFSYLLSPDTSRRVSEFYPANKTRARHLAKAGVSWGSEKATSLAANFMEPEPAKDEFSKIAEEVTRKMVPVLAAEVDNLCSATQLKRPTKSGIYAAEQQLRALSPTNGLQTPSEILNAAWAIRSDLHHWDIPGVAVERKFSILNDLVLKSFEVREWNGRAQ